MMNGKLYYSKTLPALITAAFLICACTVFTLKYTLSKDALPYIFDTVESTNRMLFCLNFYFPFAISSLCIFGCLFLKSSFFQGLCLIAGLTSAVISCYFLNDLWTINFCIYSAYVLISAAAFKPPGNYCITVFTLVFFTIFLFRPALFGQVMRRDYQAIPAIEEFIIFEFYRIIIGGTFSAIRFLTEKYLNSEATVEHLNVVGAKMLEFNHRLQEYVRNFGEEAVKKDRLRFTRDLHDSCGYVFTNIIAASNAAMSFSSMEQEKIRNTFQLILSQAQQGLNSTRETLHMIRELENPAARSIDTIFEMKTIFEEVTGIRVDIESGNMRNDYGPTVNTVLTQIVQEAFTNSVRHGQASRILIHFWEFPESLTMIVSDNGIGTKQVVKGIGLAGMEERLAAAGGHMEAFSPQDGGFRIKVTIPLVGTLLSSRAAAQENITN